MATISRTVLREQVKDVLLQRIASGELKPGERLVETRIAQELGTSQAPVREALRDLQLMRLVESEPFRGSRVRVVDEEEVMEVFPVRAALEELAARLAAERLGGDVSALVVELEAMKAAVRADDTNALAQHDIAFHRLVVEAAGNSVLEQSWMSLGVESRITISLYGVYMEPTQAAERHVKLIDAIRARNPTAAAREARKHVEVSAKLMRSHLRAASE
jgi:DNA-binding GntR family transcriptional regulator